MKTLKQWFDEMSPATQEYILKNCNWIDKTKPDYYQYEKGSFDKLKKALSSKNTESALLQCISIIEQNFPDEDIKIENLSIRMFSNADTSLWPIEKRRKHITDYRQLNSKYGLSDLLITTEDFDNINWKDLHTYNLPINACTEEMCGEKNILALMKNDVRKVWQELEMDNFDDTFSNRIFDKLFFGNNGWTQDQKIELVRNYNTCAPSIKDFMKRIVAVDIFYLKYIPHIMGSSTVLGTDIYKELKPSTELTGKESVEMRYRYPKEIRRLFQIAACCERKNIGKAMAGTIGVSASLLKIYGYNFDRIFECLYPDNTSPESNLLQS